MNILAVRIKELRTSRNMTQRELSDKLGLTPKMISFYEHDERTPPVDILNKLADIFDVSTDYLNGRTDTPQQKSAPEGAQLRDEDIMFALFDGDGEITDDMFDEVKDFARFIQERERKKAEKDESN